VGTGQSSQDTSGSVEGHTVFPRLHTARCAGVSMVCTIRIELTIAVAVELAYDCFVALSGD
jgi:hypothetical protein